MLAASATVRLGREEAAADPAHEASERVRVAGAQHRSMRSSIATACCANSGGGGAGLIRARAPRADRAPESGVAGRLQGPVQDGQRPVLLSPDGNGSLQPRPAGVSRAAVGARPPSPSPCFAPCSARWGLPDAIRTDNGAPFASTGIHGLSALECLVDATRHRPSTIRRRVRRRRAARTDASRAQTGDGAARGRQRAAPSNAASTLPPALQRGAAPRRDRRSHARLAVDALDARLSRAHRAAGVSRRIWKCAASARTAPFSAARAPALSQPRPLQGAGHRPRRSRRRRLEYRLLPDAARQDR